MDGRECREIIGVKEGWSEIKSRENEEVKRTGENRQVSGLDGGVVVVVWYSVYSRECGGRVRLESAGCLRVYNG